MKRLSLLHPSATAFTATGFGDKLAEWRDAVGVGSSVATPGIQRSVGIIMAVNQPSPHEIKAALEDSSPKLTKVFPEAADRQKLSTQAGAKTKLIKLAKTAEE